LPGKELDLGATSKIEFENRGGLTEKMGGALKKDLNQELGRSNEPLGNENKGKAIPNK